MSISLLAGTWISSVPESLGSTVNMVSSGWSKMKIRLLWWAIIAVSAIAAGLGFVSLIYIGMVDWLVELTWGGE